MLYIGSHTIHAVADISRHIARQQLARRPLGLKLDLVVDGEKQISHVLSIDDGGVRADIGAHILASIAYDVHNLVVFWVIHHLGQLVSPRLH